MSIPSLFLSEVEVEAGGDSDDDCHADLWVRTDVFHYIDYQAYVFSGMMVNQFRDTTYRCAGVRGSYQCMYASDLQQEGRIDGKAVLEAYHYGYSDGKVGEWVGILIAIIAAYRILGYVVLAMRRS